MYLSPLSLTIGSEIIYSIHIFCIQEMGPGMGWLGLEVVYVVREAMVDGAEREREMERRERMRRE